MEQLALANDRDTLSLSILTDSHLFADPEGTLLGVPCWQSFQDCLAMMESQSQFDAWLLTGDLAQDHQLVTYQRLATLMAERQQPWFWLPGNHDDPAAMTDAMGPRVRRLLGRHWQVLLLDSHQPGQVSGWLSDAELDWVSQHADDSLHTLVVLHHHPLALGSAWLDQHQLVNGQALLQRLAQHRQAKAVLFGHVHQQQDFYHGATRLLATPASCVQFTPGSDDFAVASSAPGGRHLTLHADGRISTRILRLPEHSYPVDSQAGGY